MAVDVVLDGTCALEHLAATRYDVLVLDRDLPAVHGDEVARSLAAGRALTRVLLLTAASTVADRVEGLGLGPTITCPSRSSSPSLSPGSARWDGALSRRCRQCLSAATCGSTRPAS